MFSLSFVFLLAIGAACGWFAGQVSGNGTKGLAIDMVVGVIGAALTALILPEFLAWGRLPALVAGSVFFASVLLLCVRVFRARRLERMRRLSPSDRALQA